MEKEVKTKKTAGTKKDTTSKKSTTSTKKSTTAKNSTTTKKSTPATKKETTKKVAAPKEETKAKKVTTSKKEVVKEEQNTEKKKIELNFNLEEIKSKIKNKIENLDKKQVLEITKNVALKLIMVLSIIMVIFTVVSINTFDKGDRSLFGLKAYIVRSNSMSKTDFKAGDLVIVKEIDPNKLEVGDIITFISTEEESYGETVTHKIRKITFNEKGEAGFITYGTTTDTDDKNITTYEFVQGKYLFNIPLLGRFFNFLKTGVGYFTCIFLPFLILIAYQGFKSVKLFKQYKDEQMKEVNEKLDKERKAIKEEQVRLAKEREETLAMMEELKKLKSGTTTKKTPKKTSKKAKVKEPVEDKKEKKSTKKTTAKKVTAASSVKKEKVTETVEEKPKKTTKKSTTTKKTSTPKKTTKKEETKKEEVKKENKKTSPTKKSSTTKTTTKKTTSTKKTK